MVLASCAANIKTSSTPYGEYPFRDAPASLGHTAREGDWCFGRRPSASRSSPWMRRDWCGTFCAASRVVEFGGDTSDCDDPPAAVEA